MRWIPATSPELEAPDHIPQIVDLFHAVDRGGTVEACVSVPPRHWKTTTILHGIVWLFERHPGFRVAYLTYSSDRAESASRDAMRIAERAGLRFGARKTFGEWELSNGCFFKAAGLLQGVTGEGFDLIIVDDPYRRRQDAESLQVRGRTIESFGADVYTRQGNKPTSYIVQHTRWHVRDLIGHVTDPAFRDGRPFQYVNLPAINDNGEALCPRHWPLERLAKTRATVGEYDWWSQFQGQPRPRGAEMFASPATCTMADLPRAGRYAVGVDLAYSAKTHSDYSVSVVLVEHGGTYYVVDVQRHQVDPTAFALTLKAHASRYHGPMRWYCSSIEQGAAAFIKALGIPLDARTTSSDKFVRAQPLAAAWNAGRVVVPVDAPWKGTLLDEVCSFTGVNDPHDDQVDALAAAFDALQQASTGDVYESISRRTTAGWGKHY